MSAYLSLKLSKDLRAIPEKITWGQGGRRQLIYFSRDGWCGHFSNYYMGHWCLTKSDYMGDGSGWISNSVGG